MDDLFNLYRRCFDSERLLGEICKNYKLSNGYDIDEYVAQLIIQRRELASLYAATAAKNTPDDKELYEREMSEHEEGIKRAMQLAKNEINESLIAGGLFGMGYKSIDDTALYAIPRNEWAFLIIDYKESRAFCDVRNYIGVRFISSFDIKKMPLDKSDLIYRLTNGKCLLEEVKSTDKPQAKEVKSTDKPSTGVTQRRLEILNTWYASMCDEHNNDVNARIDSMTINQIIEALTGLTELNSQYIWMGEKGSNWLMRNGKKVWKFERTKGGKSN